MAREGRDVWAKRVERWCDSGLTAREYAAEIGVNANTLQNWRWKLSQLRSPSAARPQRRRQNSEKTSERLPVIEVIGTQPAEAPKGSRDYEVVLRNQVMVRVPPSFDESSLGRLLGLLEAR